MTYSLDIRAPDGRPQDIPCLKPNERVGCSRFDTAGRLVGQVE